MPKRIPIQAVSQRGFPLRSNAVKERISFMQRIRQSRANALKAGHPLPDQLPRKIQKIFDHWGARSPRDMEILEDFVAKLRARTEKYRTARKDKQYQEQRVKAILKRRVKKEAREHDMDWIERERQAIEDEIRRSVRSRAEA